MTGQVDQSHGGQHTTTASSTIRPTNPTYPKSLFTPLTRRRQDCLVLSVSAVWTQLETRQDSFVLSRPSFQFWPSFQFPRTQLETRQDSFVLSWPSFQFPNFQKSSIYLRLNSCKLETGSRQDKTVLSCPRRQCEHNWRQDKTVLSCLDPVSNFQEHNWRREKTVLSCPRRQCEHNWDKTRQFCLDSTKFPISKNTIGDTTRQFCLVSTQFPISKFSEVLNIFETEQLQIGNWVETIQNSKSPIVFTLPTWTRQNS